jgi:hypothetical protein
MERTDIGVNEKYMLVVMSSFADRDGVCWPSISTLALRSGLGDRYVKSLIARLVEVGLLVVERRGPRSNMYHLQWIKEVNDSSHQREERLTPSFQKIGTIDPHSGERSFTQNYTKELEEQIQIPSDGGSGALSYTFAEWYALYPRKEDRFDAEQEWGKIIKAKKASSATMVEALKQQLPSMERAEPRYILKPAKWLAKGSWTNEVALTEIQKALRDAGVV